MTAATVEPNPPNMLVLVLLVAVFAAAIIDVAIPISILDIANTYGVLPGSVGQLNSIIAVATVATALFLAAFGVKFRYKGLVVVGILFIVACDVGLFLAPTFQAAQIIVALNGIGSVLIVVTTQTLIGNYFSLNKKAKAIGWVAATGTLANAVGAPIVGFMAGASGWRSVFLWFMLPTAVASLILVLLTFSQKPTQKPLVTTKQPFLKGYKQVLSNKSAVACLATGFLGNAFAFGSVAFEVTFLRQIFSIEPGYAAVIGTLAGTALVTVGAIIGGYTVNRLGRKRLTMTSIFFAGLLTLISYSTPDLSAFLALRWVASAFLGITLAAASNLMLEQVPQSRGTAMSLASAFSGIGTAVGVFVAGTVLNIYSNPVTGFQALGLTVGAFAIAAALINFFFVKDPIKSSMITAPS
ncbi:MAG: MFS transporter [Candidatus Bathyarchaeota archaeon]|nr:MFS transporter [Candidatus Bathyarchaeota archaeon]